MRLLSQHATLRPAAQRRVMGMPDRQCANSSPTILPMDTVSYLLSLGEASLHLLGFLHCHRLVLPSVLSAVLPSHSNAVAEIHGTGHFGLKSPPTAQKSSYPTCILMEPEPCAYSSFTKLLGPQMSATVSHREEPAMGPSGEGRKRSTELPVQPGWRSWQVLKTSFRQNMILTAPGRHLGPSEAAWQVRCHRLLPKSKFMRSDWSEPRKQHLHACFCPGSMASPWDRMRAPRHQLA